MEKGRFRMYDRKCDVDIRLLGCALVLLVMALLTIHTGLAKKAVTAAADPAPAAVVSTQDTRLSEVAGSSPAWPTKKARRFRPSCFSFSHQNLSLYSSLRRLNQCTKFFLRVNVLDGFLCLYHLDFERCYFVLLHAPVKEHFHRTDIVVDAVCGHPAIRQNDDF